MDQGQDRCLWKKADENSFQKSYLKNAVFVVRFLYSSCSPLPRWESIKECDKTILPWIARALHSAIGKDKKGIQVSPSCWGALSTESHSFLCSQVLHLQERGCVSCILRRPESSIFGIACSETQSQVRKGTEGTRFFPPNRRSSDCFDRFGIFSCLKESVGLLFSSPLMFSLGKTGSLSGFICHLKPMGESHKSTGSDLPYTGRARINRNTSGHLCSGSSAWTSTLRTPTPSSPQRAPFPYPYFDNWDWKAVNFGRVIFMEEILKNIY